MFLDPKLWACLTQINIKNTFTEGDDHQSKRPEVAEQRQEATPSGSFALRGAGASVEVEVPWGWSWDRRMVRVGSEGSPEETRSLQTQGRGRPRRSPERVRSSVGLCFDAGGRRPWDCI